MALILRVRTLKLLDADPRYMKSQMPNINRILPTVGAFAGAYTHN
jgi:hypothetical protein